MKIQTFFSNIRNLLCRNKNKIIIAVCAVSIICLGVLLFILLYDATPTGEYTIKDWETCGFLDDRSWENIHAKLGTGSGVVCSDGPGNAGTLENFDFGSISNTTFWIDGTYPREHTESTFDIYIDKNTDIIKLPRGIVIGSPLSKVERAYRLGNISASGIYYGDGIKAPYAVMKTSEYIPKRRIVMALPFEKTDEYESTLELHYGIDENDNVADVLYVYRKKYLPQLSKKIPHDVISVKIILQNTQKEAGMLSDEEITQLKDILANGSQEYLSDTIDISEFGFVLLINDGKGIEKMYCDNGCLEFYLNGYFYMNADDAKKLEKIIEKYTY